jgi:phage-related baseplate assembly protein
MANDLSNAGAPEYGLDLVPDIDFAVKDPTVIQSEVIADYQSAFKTLTGIVKTLAPGDPVRLHLLVVCHWLSHQRVIVDFTGKQNLLKYAHDDYLDNLGALYGPRAARLQPQPAMCTLRFSLAAPLAFDAVVPKGTQCQAPNAVVFVTQTDGFIISPNLSCDVLAEALVTGAIGNNFAPGQIGSIINWNQPWSLDVSNIDTTAGGSDQETDQQYRYRLWLATESFSTCGPHDAYEFWALSSHPDIIQAVIYSAPEIAGEVWIYPLLEGGVLPTQEIMDLVAATCSADTRRPLTDFVTVKLATEFVYTLDFDYYVLSDNEVLLSTIQSNVQQAVTDWILWQRSAIGRDLNSDELIKRVLEGGAKRVVINSPSPSFQVMNFDQLAVHDPNIAPLINFAGLEDA